MMELQYYIMWYICKLKYDIGILHYWIPQKFVHTMVKNTKNHPQHKGTYVSHEWEGWCWRHTCVGILDSKCMYMHMQCLHMYGAFTYACMFAYVYIATVASN